jgi:hypothetical protein
MNVTRLASFAALVAIAGACHTAVPTEPAAEVVARPAFDGGNGFGSGNFVSEDGDFETTTAGDSTGVVDNRGGMYGSGN